MSKDIHVRIIKKDREKGIWEQVKLYRKCHNEFKVVDIYPYRNYILFDILSENEDDGYIAYPIAEADLPIDLKNEINSYKEKMTGFYNFKENTLADLKLYLKNVPKIRDYDYEDDDPKAWRDNPVKYFIEIIEQYIDFVDPNWEFTTSNSDIRILYWFDC